MTDREDTPTPGWRAVVHRWFVQYNPLYLISAALVLVGVTLLMEVATEQRGLFGQLSSTVVAELYAWALIASAAVLTRRGLWRPAVMLALITALYQCDLTLQTERSVYLGVPGMVASGLWLISFAAKLRALAWAMQFRLSRSALWVAVAGGTVQMLIPWILSKVQDHIAAPLLALMVFWVLAAGLWTFRRTESWSPRTAWGETVARRAARFVWVGWAGALIAHVLFVTEYGPPADRAFFIPLALVLMTRRFRTEELVWGWLVATLFLVAMVSPAHFATTAIMAASALVLRALRAPTLVSREVEAQDPYRAVLDVPTSWSGWTLAPSSPEAIRRLLAGAWTCLYLGVWTAGWDFGPWPEHVLWVDTLFLTLTVLGAWRSHCGLVLLPVCVSVLHLALVERLVPTPQSNLQWGLAAVGAGFGLLAVGLGVSIRLRPQSGHRAPSRRAPAAR